MWITFYLVLAQNIIVDIIKNILYNKDISIKKINMKQITEKQKKLLETIEKYQKKYKNAPTQKQLAEIFNVSQASIWGRMNALIKKGYLSQNKLLIIKK